MKLIALLALLLALGTIAPAQAADPANRIGLASLAAAQPDLDAAYIGRTPRYDYDAAKNQPAAGEPVVFEGHVANRSAKTIDSFSFAWYIDDQVAQAAVYPHPLAPNATATLMLSWTWQPGPHTLSLRLDPDNQVAEVSEQNNRIDDRTDALAVGFWVEQSVYDYFNTHQAQLGLGSVSWDDWAQRQLQAWNGMFAAAISPLTPQGVLDRVRLDKVTVVPNGALPSCATNFPDINDKTIDLQWGFPAEEVGIPSGHSCGALNYYFDNPAAQNIEYSLMHELSHARYLVDLYGLNIYLNATHLASASSSASTTLTADRDVEHDDNFPTPVALAIDGELVICQSKSGSSFGDCARGAEGTYARAHASGVLINNAIVRLHDSQGNLVQGSPALPVRGAWEDHLYFNRYADDMMGGGDWTGYKQYSAYALNRIAGRRPICGNYNSPCNIGEYLNDIPAHNIVEIHDKNNHPLPGARVDVFQAQPFAIWYGKQFHGPPNLSADTNFQGRADLGAFPFGSAPPIVHSYGHSNTVLLLRLSSGGVTNYQFFEVTQANEAFWRGQRDAAVYMLNTDLPAGQPLSLRYVPLARRE